MKRFIRTSGLLFLIVVMVAVLLISPVQAEAEQPETVASENDEGAQTAASEETAGSEVTEETGEPEEPQIQDEDAEPEELSDRPATEEEQPAEPAVEQEAENPDQEEEEEPEDEPEPKSERAFGDNLFKIVDGEIIWLSITEEELAEYAMILRDELGLNLAGVAGILANLQFESGFDPNKIGDMGFAYGLCQWRGPRLDDMVSFCEENGLNPVQMESQLYYLAHDLRENYIYTYDLIRMLGDSEDAAMMATYYFCAYYEAPLSPDDESPPREELVWKLIYPALQELEEAGWI